MWHAPATNSWRRVRCSLRERVSPLREADPILIVGAGMAGALTALRLGRAGYGVRIFDRHSHPRPTFRAEKLTQDQIEGLRELGALEAFEQANWGAVATRQSPDQLHDLSNCGARHEAWLDALWNLWPSSVTFTPTAVDAIYPDRERPCVRLSTGETVFGRLVVVASGTWLGADSGLDLDYEIVSPRHSVCVGLSLAKSDDGPGEVVEAPPGSALSYVSFIPMDDELRLNIFTFDPDDAGFLPALKADPIKVLSHAMPNIAAKLHEAVVTRPFEIRIVDLKRMKSPAQDGVVVIGDAFATVCPASGTGMTKVIADVKALTEIYAPRWFATPGLGSDKIAQFYADPHKCAADALALKRSINGRKSVLGETPYWRARRLVGRFKRGLELAAAQWGRPAARPFGISTRRGADT